ncbi:MAG: Metal-dependent hydrolase YbeY, involved in rRNA and/or ribosome maturation and assembly [uncultured Aureispira sp.]|uniref:Endoribonuclease YbeY n=1 Tax=uncultured Aureispira sp. TaxID=1331704 RepID=A0A6S6T450_9BACT|nr:MAG: Metal-dependent hydrolase YbeY, involved in rRNA and/or ribosome maturation and assembly [uncultured Aureispira sp.]
MQLTFHAEEIDFELEEASKIDRWLKSVIKNENWILAAVTYIFCSDAYLYQMNVEHLQHDTYTDVITFQYNEEFVEGDIFISIERTNENAQTFGVSSSHELHRVMVHGLLHLMGYKDKEPADKKLMTEKENEYLELLKPILALS